MQNIHISTSSSSTLGRKKFCLFSKFSLNLQVAFNFDIKLTSLTQADALHEKLSLQTLPDIMTIKASKLVANQTSARNLK